MSDTKTFAETKTVTTKCIVLEHGDYLITLSILNQGKMTSVEMMTGEAKDLAEDLLRRAKEIREEQTCKK